MPVTTPAAKSSSVHSISSFSMKGSPTCTLGRLAGPSASNVSEASTETPPMPSPPVRAPYRMTWLPTPRRLGEVEVLVPQHADAERVDQRVAEVGLVEDRLAADVGQAEHVAVATDAGDDPGQHPVGVVGVERAEAERVHHRDRARAHREDVADDAADAGRRALVGLDVRRVVVRLDLERDGVALADVDDAGVLTDAGEHLADRRLLRDLGELLEVHLARTCRSSARSTSREYIASSVLVGRRPRISRICGVLVGLQAEVGPRLVAAGVLGGDGDGVEAGQGRGGRLARRQSTGAAGAPDHRVSAAARRRRPPASGVRRPSSRSAWSATAATPPTSRHTGRRRRPARSASCLAEPVDDPLAGAPQHLALGADRGVGVAHRRGDLGRAALVQADQRDVLVEPGQQQVAGRRPRGRGPCRRPRRPGRPSSA